MYNCEARLPVDVCIPGWSKVTDGATVDDQVLKLVDVKKKIHNQVKENILKAQEKKKLLYARKNNMGSTMIVGMQDEIKFHVQL